MLNDAGRSFGHWRSAPKKPVAKADAKSDAPQDSTPTSRPPRSAGESSTDSVRDTLETIAGRRQRRDRLVEAPLPPEPKRTPDVRETLERLAERKRADAAQGDLTEPMWDRVIRLAKPLVNDQPATPPRSPAPRPSGPQRRIPER
jgi:hypothetical protein